ncbi:hypothetical protein [Lentiprolixibacter aurantiacus]|uniref:Glycine zipper domain-containing protein n=1 Tax=Lentiprolixibacter aurantiacus TaxID=2993939 RepID=A0AAE3MK44_9FLAO|nr:hypothetical protein [Lentiprolixibacter aurantiacus]MCX2718888.1 hypothetical protein [Lentiprolixibacter aurantiacus]
MRIIPHFYILLLFSASSLHAQIENDKVAHFAIGAFSGAGGAFIASELTDRNRFWTFTGSLAGSLLVGLAKEAIDERNSNNSWDNGDLGATVIGGMAVGITIELISKKDGKRYQNRRNKIISDQNATAAVEFLLMDAEYNRNRLVNINADE